MFNRLVRFALLGGATMSLALLLNTGTAMAGATECTGDFDCDGIPDNKDNCPKVFDLTNKCEVPPPPKGICHNIGGPNQLGANCDALAANNITLECRLIQDPGLLEFYFDAVDACNGLVDCINNIYAGILVPFSPQAAVAHHNHGDGVLLASFDRIHDPLPHVSANVDCFGTRSGDILQPPEPGN